MNDYSLDQNKFLELMVDSIKNRDMSESLRLTFQLFDQVNIILMQENKGFVVLKDIKRVCKEIGEQVSDQELEMMMAHIDESGDGSVTVDEWITVMAESF